MVKAQSKTQSIGSEIRQVEGTEGGGSRKLSETCKVASRGLSSKEESEEERKEEVRRWKESGRTLVVSKHAPYKIITLLAKSSLGGMMEDQRKVEVLGP